MILIFIGFISLNCLQRQYNCRGHLISDLRGQRFVSRTLLGWYTHGNLVGMQIESCLNQDILFVKSVSQRRGTPMKLSFWREWQRISQSHSGRQLSNIYFSHRRSPRLKKPILQKLIRAPKTRPHWGNLFFRRCSIADLWASVPTPTMLVSFTFDHFCCGFYFCSCS